MKRARRWALLILCAALLSGCAAQQPAGDVRGGEGQTLISADTEGLAPAALSAALYFRYAATPYLAPQVRQIDVQRDETPERAIVQALLDGPSGAAGFLNALFPPGTEVLATLSQGDTLFITFNEALMGRYADESAVDLAPSAREEAALRRRLCLDALSATLTEAGLCARVQVLVYRGASQGNSMRLPAGFLDQSGDESLLAPLTRREDSLLTPHNTAALLMNAWMNQDWAGLYDFTARGGGSARPREQSAYDAYAEGRTLIRYSLSPGSVSLDGKAAVVSVDMTLLGEAEDGEIAGYPLRLQREDGLWKIGFEDLIRMMNQD